MIASKIMDKGTINVQNCCGVTAVGCSPCRYVRQYRRVAETFTARATSLGISLYLTTHTEAGTSHRFLLHNGLCLSYEHVP